MPLQSRCDPDHIRSISGMGKFLAYAAAGLVVLGYLHYSGVAGDGGPGAIAASSLSAFYGAWLAYALNETKEMRQDRARRIASARLAQVALQTQVSRLVSMRKQCFSLFREMPNRWAQMPPYLAPGKPLHVQYESIAWLANEMKADLLQKISIAEQCHDTFFDTLAFRNDVMTKARSGPTDGINTAVPPQLAYELKSVTDACFNLLDDAITQMGAAINDTFSTMKEMYPKELFYRFDEAQMVRDTPMQPDIEQAVNKMKSSSGAGSSGATGRTTGATTGQ